MYVCIQAHLVLHGVLVIPLFPPPLLPCLQWCYKVCGCCGGAEAARKRREEERAKKVLVSRVLNDFLVFSPYLQ